MLLMKKIVISSFSPVLIASRDSQEKPIYAIFAHRKIMLSCNFCLDVNISIVFSEESIKSVELGIQTCVFTREKTHMEQPTYCLSSLFARCS